MKHLKKQYTGEGQLSSAGLVTKSIIDSNAYTWYYVEACNEVFLDSLEDLLTSAEVPYSLDRNTFILTIHERQFLVMLGCYLNSATSCIGNFFSYPLELPKSQLSCSYRLIPDMFTYSSGTQFTYNFSLEVIYTEHCCYIWVTIPANSTTFTLLGTSKIKLLTDGTDAITYNGLYSIFIRNNNMNPPSIHIGGPYQGKTLLGSSVFKHSNNNFYAVSNSPKNPSTNTTYYGWLGNKIPLIPWIDTACIIQYYGMYTTYSGKVIAGEFYEINGKVYYAGENYVLLCD